MSNNKKIWAMLWISDYLEDISRIASSSQWLGLSWRKQMSLSEKCFKLNELFHLAVGVFSDSLRSCQGIGLFNTWSCSLILLLALLSHPLLGSILSAFCFSQFEQFIFFLQLLKKKTLMEPFHSGPVFMLYMINTEGAKFCLCIFFPSLVKQKLSNHRGLL